MADKPVAGIYIELRAMVAKFQSDMESAVRSVNSAQTKMTKAFGVIDKVVKGALVIGGVAAIAKMTSAIGTLAEKGDELDDLRASFQRLGGSSEQLQAAKDALLGTVSSMDLMKIANAGLIKQIPGLANNFGMLADYAGRFAEATGKDAREVLEKLVGSLGRAKAAQLAQIGVTIDADKAYAEYATRVNKTVETLSESEKKLVRQEAALEAVRKKMEELLPMGDSLNAAQTALNVSMEEAKAKFGIAIAANDDLIKAYRTLSSEIDNIDWEQAGEDAAKFFALLAKAATTILPYVIDEAQKAAFALRWMFSDDLEIRQKKATVELGNLIKEQKRLKEAMAESEGSIVYEALAADLRAVEAEIEKVRPKYEELTSKVETSTINTDKQREALARLNEALKNNETTLTGSNSRTREAAAAAAKVAKETEKAAEKVKKLANEWQKYKEEAKEKDLSSQLEAAIARQDIQTVTRLKASLQQAVQEGFVKKWQEAISSKAISLEEVQKEASKIAEQLGIEIETNMAEGAARAAQQAAQEFDKLTDSLQKLGDALGLDLGGIADSFRGLSDETKKGIQDGIQKGLKDIGLEVDTEDLQASIDGLSAVLGPLMDAGELNKKTKSEAGTGQAIGAVGGAAIAAYYGLPPEVGAKIGGEIGKAIGGMFKWGPQNPETQARHAFANFVEEGFKKLGQVAFRDAAGQMTRMTGKQFNFLEGAVERFNIPGWADSMKELDDTARSTFLGLGKGFQEMLGLTEKVAGQIGYLLAENLNGNIDNARLLVAQLGVSFEDLTEKLTESAMQGKMRWIEFEIAVAGIAEAFKPGIAAVGDLRGAMDQLIGSGGRGVAAIKSVKDIAVEAMEAGARTFEELGQMMLAQGTDPQIVQDFLDSLRQRGIRTLEELANASDRVAGGIVAELEARNTAIRAQWEQMTQDLEGLRQTIEKIPTEKDVKINVQTRFDENTRTLMNNQTISGATMQVQAERYAVGGVVDRPTFFAHSGGLGVAGEAGAEAIMPLTRIGGKLGVMAAGKPNGGGVTYVIDARGASPGVESRIRAALREVEDRAVKRSINAMQDGYRRGARL